MTIKLRDEAIRWEYKPNLSNSLNRKRESINEDANAEELFEVFKETVLQITEKVVGTKMVKVGKKGNDW